MIKTIVNNRYLLKHQLGAGGMGVVHLAQDRLTNEEVALKQIHLPAEKLQFMSRPDPEHVQDLQLSLAREFQSLASLRHPNIISVLDFGFDQERQPFFTMNYLSDAMTILSADQQLSFKEKVTLIQQIFQALAYLHRRGVLHRDIKPDNILVQNDHLRLLDFGLSRSDTEEQLSSSGGTLAYWPPENWLQQPYVASSDLFAAGIVMFELLTGQHPFGPVDAFLVDRVLDEEPNWDCLSGYENFRPIFEKLLHKSPEARYQDPHDLLSALGSLLGEPLSTENDEIREGYIQAASFVGREAELETLSQTLDQVKANDKQIWLVGGESGVGKSRLLEEIRIKALVSGWQVFRGQAVETGGLSFQIWQELIPQLVLGIDLSDIEAGILKTFVPNLDQLLGRRIPEARVVDDASSLRRFIQTLVNLLQRQKEPTLLLLEDLQWSRESLTPLNTLMRSGGHQLAPLMVLGSYRNDERPELPDLVKGANILELNRLAEADVAELSRAILGDQVANREELISRLQEETEGNTFFLVEIIRTLAVEAGNLANIDNLVLPEQMLTGGIAKLIQRRLERVIQKDRSLLRFAAAIGRSLDISLLRQLATDAGVHSLELWLNRCQDGAILALQDNRWLFAHDKIRETILATLDSTTVFPLYTRVAEVVEAVYPDDVTQAAALAHYWQMAGNDEKECRYAILAGKEAKRRFAHEETVAFCLRALELIPEPNIKQRFNVSIDLERAYYMQGKRELQASIISKIEDQADLLGANETAYALSRRAVYALALGDVATLQELGETLRQIGEVNESPAILIDANIALSQAHLHTGRLKEAEKYAKTAVNLLKISKSNSDRDASYLISILGICADLRGDYERANQYNFELIEFGEQTGDKYIVAVAQGNVGLTASMQGDFHTGYEMMKQSQILFNEVGETFGSTAALINLAYIDLQLLPQRAPQAFKEALTASREIESAPYLLETLVGVAEVYFNGGEFEKAAEIVGLTRSHPSINSDVEMRLKDFEPKLKEQVAADQWDALVARGATKTIEDVIEDYILQFPFER